MKRQLPALFLLSLVLFVSAGCGAVAEVEEDTDHRRGIATESPLGEVISDVISPNEGDAIDWKSIPIPAAGLLVVTVFWDKPKQIRGATITVTDKFGTKLGKKDHDPNSASDEITVEIEAPGYHYIKVQAVAGKSIYSIQVVHSPGSNVPRPEFGMLR